MGKIRAVITGVGGYVPEYVLTNEELSRMVDTSDEWIMTRIGVKERRILNEEGLGTGYMARKAAKQLMAKTGYDPDSIEARLGARLDMRDVARSKVNHADQLSASPVKPSKHLGDAICVREYAPVWIKRPSLVKEPDLEKVNASTNDAFKHSNERIVSEAPVVVVPAITKGTV